MGLRHWLGILTICIFAGVGLRSSLAPLAARTLASSDRNLEACRNLNTAEAHEVRVGLTLAEMVDRTLIRLSALERSLGLRERQRRFRDRRALLESWFNDRGFNSAAQNQWLAPLVQGCERRRGERALRGLCGRPNSNPRFETQAINERFEQIYRSQNFDDWVSACHDLYAPGLRSVETAAHSMQLCIPALWVQARVSMSDRGRSCIQYMIAEDLNNLADFDALSSFLRSDRSYSCLPGDGTSSGLCRENSCIRAVSYQVKHDQLPETPFLSSENLQGQFRAERSKIKRHLAEEFSKTLLDSLVRVGLLKHAVTQLQLDPAFFTTQMRGHLASQCGDSHLQRRLDSHLTQLLTALPPDLEGISAQIEDLPRVVVGIQKLRELHALLKVDTGETTIRVDQDPIFSQLGRLFFLVPTLRRMFDAPMYLNWREYASTQCNSIAVMGGIGQTQEPMNSSLITRADQALLEKLSDPQFVSAAFGLRGDIPDALAEFVRTERNIQNSLTQNRRISRATWCSMRARAASAVLQEILTWNAQYPVLNFQENEDSPSFFERLVEGGNFDVRTEVARISTQLSEDLLKGVHEACALNPQMTDSLVAQGGFTPQYCNTLSEADSRALGLSCTERFSYLSCEYRNEVRERDLRSRDGETAMGVFQATLDATMVFSVALKGLSLSGLFNPRNWAVGGAAGGGFAWLSERVGQSMSEGQAASNLTYMRSMAATGLEGESGYAQVLDHLAATRGGLTAQELGESILIGAIYGAVLGPGRGEPIALSPIRTEARTQLAEILATRTGRRARLAAFLLAEGRLANAAPQIRLNIARLLLENARVATALSPAAKTSIKQFLKSSIANAFTRMRERLAPLRDRLMLRRARGEAATVAEEAAEILNQVDGEGKPIDVRIAESSPQWEVQDQARVLDAIEQVQRPIGPESAEAAATRIGEFWNAIRSTLAQCRAPLGRCGALIGQAAESFRQAGTRVKAYVRYRLGLGDRAQFERVMTIMEEKLARFNRNVEAWEQDFLTRYNGAQGGIEIFEEALALLCAKSPTFMMSAAEVWGSNRAFFWRMMDLSDRFKSLRQNVGRRLLRQPEQQTLLRLTRNYVRVLTKSELNANQLFDVMGEMAELIHRQINPPEFSRLWFASVWERLRGGFKGSAPWQRFAQEYAAYERAQFQIQGNVRGRGIRPEVIREFMNEGVMQTLYRRLSARRGVSPEEIRLLVREASWFMGPVVIAGNAAWRAALAYFLFENGQYIANAVGDWIEQEPEESQIPEDAVLVSRGDLAQETRDIFNDGRTDERLAASNRAIAALEAQRDQTRDTAQRRALEVRIENERSAQAMELMIQEAGQ